MDAVGVTITVTGPCAAEVDERGVGIRLERLGVPSDYYPARGTFTNVYLAALPIFPLADPLGAAEEQCESTERTLQSYLDEILVMVAAAKHVEGRIRNAVGTSLTGQELQQALEAVRLAYFALLSTTEFCDVAVDRYVSSDGFVTPLALVDGRQVRGERVFWDGISNLVLTLNVPCPPPLPSCDPPAESPAQLRALSEGFVEEIHFCPVPLPPDVIITPMSPLITTEAGGTARFSVVLKNQPAGLVRLPINSTDPGEGQTNRSFLDFDVHNWRTLQIVTVTGQDDTLDDGDQPYMVQLGAAVSAQDARYNGFDPPDVNLVNRDNDNPGFVVSPISGLVTTEAAGTATFSVRLTLAPTANVVINLSSSDTTEGTVSASSLTFTAANWSTPQTVTVRGVDDNLDDGDVAYTIFTSAAVSSDAGYRGLNPPDVSVVNRDNDEFGIAITPNSGLVTTEAGGMATFTVKLTAAPTASVTINLSSSDTSEGTVSPTSLTFTTSNWNTPRTVTVRGIDDPQDDGDVAYTVITAPATSNDLRYRGLNPPDVSVVNQDNDNPTNDVRRFDGSYTGNVPAGNGPIAFTVNNGVITVTQPGPGSGTVNANGVGSFDTGPTPEFPTLHCHFDGTWVVSSQGVASASGTFFCSFVGGTSSGTWFATRNSSLQAIAVSDREAEGATAAPSCGCQATQDHSMAEPVSEKAVDLLIAGALSDAAPWDEEQLVRGTADQLLNARLADGRGPSDLLGPVAAHPSYAKRLQATLGT